MSGITSKSLWVPVQLECGHTFPQVVKYPYLVPDEFLDCPECGHPVALYAVECREWRSKCIDGCRFTRWTGQSSDAASTASRAHNLSKGHRSGIRYTINPTTFVRIRKGQQLFSKPVRYRIDGKPLVKFVRRRNTPDVPGF